MGNGALGRSETTASEPGSYNESTSTLDYVTVSVFVFFAQALVLLEHVRSV